MENIKLHKRDDLVSGIFRSSPSEMLKKIFVLNIFFKYQENISRKVCHHLKGSWAPVNGCFCEWLLLAISTRRYCFPLKNRPPESNRMLLWKNTLTKKNISFKEKGLINKVKCFTENNREVWSDRKLLFWLAKNLWVETKQLTKFSRLEYYTAKCGSDLQTFKHDLLGNLGYQISGISRQPTPSMLVSIRAQYLHFLQVSQPILLFLPFVAALLLLARPIAAINNWNFWFCRLKSAWFQSQSSFQFLTQCHTEADICWRTFCQITWSEIVGKKYYLT